MLRPTAGLRNTAAYNGVGGVKRVDKRFMKTLMKNDMLCELIFDMDQIQKSVKEEFKLHFKENLTKVCVEVLKKNKTKIFLEETERDIEELIRHAQAGLYIPAAINYAGQLVLSKDQRFANSNEVSYHQVQCILYSLKLGRELGLSQSEQNDLSMGVGAHDTGKFPMLDLVTAPRRLTASEEKIIKMHPEAGHAIIIGSGYEMSPRSLDIVLSHHEKMDGSGYPYSIRNVQPLTKIATVIDMFDGLTDEGRGYRKSPFSIRKALDILIEDAHNGKIDKDVVDKLVKLNRGSRLHPRETGYYVGSNSSTLNPGAYQ